MTDTMTSQNIDLSSPGTLYMQDFALYKGADCIMALCNMLFCKPTGISYSTLGKWSLGLNSGRRN
jgi:hypothetical protein